VGTGRAVLTYARAFAWAIPLPWPPRSDRGWRVAGLLAALTTAATALLHLRGFAGAFLSDDFGYVHVIAHMDQDRVLANWAFAHLVEPVAAGNFAYRPITILSWVIDWKLFGSWAAGWRIQSLLLHLANTALVYCIAAQWMFGRIRWHGSALLPAALFAAFPFAGEATFWISSRADDLAALFSLLFLATLDGGPRVAGARRQAARVTLLGAALLSKESAFPLAAVALVVDLALRATREGPPSRSQLPSYVRFVAVDLAPSWLVFAAYLAWRSILFGTPLKVYPQSTLPAGAGEYLERLASYGGLFARQTGIDAPWRWMLVAAALLVTLLACLIIGSRDRRHRGVPLVFACGFCALVYALSPALLSGVDAEISDGGRNLYVAWLYLSLAVGLAATFTRIGVVAVLAAIGWMLVAQERSLSQWQVAASEMRPLLAAVPSLANSLDQDQYALLLLPDHVDHALFARNAEGGIVDWPVQDKNYLTVMAGMTGLDLPGWREHFVDGSIARLKHVDGFDMSRFAGVFCWSSRGSRFAQVAPAGSVDDFDVWARELATRVAKSNCMRGTLDSK
jgi:hypothetical protein